MLQSGLKVNGLRAGSSDPLWLWLCDVRPLFQGCILRPVSFCAETKYIRRRIRRTSVLLSFIQTHSTLSNYNEQQLHPTANKKTTMKRSTALLFAAAFTGLLAQGANAVPITCADLVTPTLGDGLNSVSLPKQFISRQRQC